MFNIEEITNAINGVIINNNNNSDNINNSNTNSNNILLTKNKNYNYIEFWDENNNLIDAQKIIETAQYDMLQKGIFNLKKLCVAQIFENNFCVLPKIFLFVLFGNRLQYPSQYQVVSFRNYKRHIACRNFR